MWQLQYREGLQRELHVWLTNRTQQLPRVLSGLLAEIGLYIKSLEKYYEKDGFDKRDPSAASASLHALGQLGDTRETVITALLKGFSSDLRCMSAAALGELGDSREVVINTLLEPLHYYLRVDDTGSREAVITAFLKRLRDNRYWETEPICHASAVALGLLGDKREVVIAVLLESLRSWNENVCYRSAEILKHLHETSRATDFLLPDLKNENKYVRYLSARVLLELDKIEEAVPVLLGMLKDDERNVRSGSAAALRRLGNQHHEVLIVALLERLRNGSAEVRCDSAVMLGELANKHEVVIVALLETLRDSDASVRSASAYALGKLSNQHEVVIIALLERLRDVSRYVRSASAIALGKLGNRHEVVINHLWWGLSDQDENVRSASAIALGQLGNKHEVVIAALLKYLKDEKEDVYCCDSAEALVQLGNTQAVMQVLFEQLKRREWSHRYGNERHAKILVALAAKSEEVMSRLIAGLEDKNLRVRCTIAKVLVELGNTSEAVIGVLLDGLKYWHVRPTNSLGLELDGLFDALSEERRPFSDPEGMIPMLWAGISDDYDDIRLASAKALKQLGDARESVIVALLARLKDIRSASVREASAEALGFLLGASNLCQKLECYMNRQFKSILTLATPLPPQLKCFTGPRQDPCERLMAQSLHYLFSWFQPKTLAQARLVNRRWNEEIGAYEASLSEILPTITAKHLRSFSQQVNADPTVLGLKEQRGKIKILSCYLRADRRGYNCKLQRNNQVKTIRLPISQIARLLSGIRENNIGQKFTL